MALSNDEILAGLAELVNEETGIAADTVTGDKSFTDDLDIDSISMMTIVVNAESKFDVEIPDSEVENLKTVQDAVDYIAKAQAALCVGGDPPPRGGLTTATSAPRTWSHKEKRRS
jgi:acyl carrier protein